MGAQKIVLNLLKITDYLTRSAFRPEVELFIYNDSSIGAHIRFIGYRDFYVPYVKYELIEPKIRFQFAYTPIKASYKESLLPYHNLYVLPEGKRVDITKGVTVNEGTLLSWYTKLIYEDYDYMESIWNDSSFASIKQALIRYAPSIVLSDNYKILEQSTKKQQEPTPQGATTMSGKTTFTSTTTKQYEPTSTKGTTTMDDAKLNEILNGLLSAVSDLSKAVKPSPLEEKLLEAVIARTSEIATVELEQNLQKRLDTFIERKYGKLPQQISIQIGSAPTQTIQGVFHKRFKDILTMVSNDVPVMLTGAAGVGKNYTIEQVAKALGLTFYYTGSITQEYKLTGFIDAGGRFHETEFYKAFKNGGVFMLDEVDASSPETLVILNGAIANRYFDFPNGRIEAHPDFRVVCAGNTFGTGADMIYVGRNVLDGATLDRFVVIKMDYDLDVERQLCPDKSYHDFVVQMRNLVDKFKLRHIIGMRASINGYKALQAGMSKAFVVESILLKGLSLDDLQVLVKGTSDSSEWLSEVKNYYNNLTKGVE